MTTRDTQRSITPGSTEYGDRAGLEQGLSDVLSGGGAGGGASSPGGPTALPDRGNPLSDLLSGSIDPHQQGPLTDGLTHGPGEGPPGAAGPLANDLGSKLQMVARHAASPVLRKLAQDRLRRMYKENS